MKKHWLLSLLLVLPCCAGAGPKPKPLPMPPLTSHNEPLSNYACIFSPTSQMSSVEYWDVIAFAEYGKNHKRYWSKSLGTFRGTQSITSHNSESAGSGGAIGMIAQDVQYGDGSKKCEEWRQAVHDSIDQSQKK